MKKKKLLFIASLPSKTLYFDGERNKSKMFLILLLQKIFMILESLITQKINIYKQSNSFYFYYLIFMIGFLYQNVLLAALSLFI